MDTKASLKDHLLKCHREELYKLKDTQLEDNNIFLCRHCDDHLAISPGWLVKHIKSKHESTRKKGNLQLATSKLYSPVKISSLNHWQNGLQWLQDFTPSPPSFRQSLISKIKFEVEDAVLCLFEDLIALCVETNKKADESSLEDDFNFQNEHIWKLPFIFEQLILAPKPYSSSSNNKKKDLSIRKLIYHRIRLFRSGQLEQLYNESCLVHSRSRSSYAATPPDKNACAQEAADNDNFRSCQTRLGNDLGIAPLNEANIPIIEKLFPPSLQLNIREQRRNRGSHMHTRSSINKKKLVFTPQEVINHLLRLRRHKAPGIQVDSLDLFIKLARRRSNEKRKKDHRRDKSITTQNLASFFTIIAQGNLPPAVTELIRTTYLVALQKDANDLTKLRPLGIPAAIRRITASMIVYKFKSDFAEYLLPFNYAVGISGGLDLITNTIRMGVEKYISTPEDNFELPSRALISIDIRNMFNAVSREKLREIIRLHFPTLEEFADLLYDDFGKVFAKKEDGSWLEIAVEEGFAQGCPISPIFGALVLGVILKKVHADLDKQVANRIATNVMGDDNKGGETITMAYIDDVNCLVPHEDVKFFLDKFKLYGEELGGIMNTEKTKILTSTHNTSTVQSLKDTNDEFNQLVAEDLETAIALYSRQKLEDGSVVPHEVTDGLRVLGSPVGNNEYCQDFFQKQLKKAKTSASRLLQGLESQQTILQVFRACTSTKMTHLFASDVVCSPDLPDINKWDLFQSPMCVEFDKMTENVLASLMGVPSIPDASIYMASMATQFGGLGIQNPRATAIPSFVINVKRCLGYINNGVWIGHNHPTFTLPNSITSIWASPESSPSTTLKLFYKYLPSIESICVSDLVPNKRDFFLNKSSVNTCRERIKEAVGNKTRSYIKIAWELNKDKPSLDNFTDILHPNLAQGLLDMPRLDNNNRLDNQIFSTILKRKLRIPLYQTNDQLICPRCKQHFDVYGDHLFKCIKCVPNKKITHNKWRDDVEKHVMKDILPLVKLIDKPSETENEKTKCIPSLRNTKIKPFDLSFKVNKNIGESYYRSPLRRIGFDITMSQPSNEPPNSDITRAQNNSIALQLLECEMGKFNRKEGGTNPTTKVTLSGDQIIGELTNSHQALLPWSISPYGMFGDIASRFWYGNDAVDLSSNLNKRSAKSAAKLAVSSKVPSGILKRANKIWQHKHPGDFFGRSYKSQTPMIYTRQVFGRLTCLYNGQHIINGMDTIGDPIPVITNDTNVDNAADMDDLPHDYRTLPSCVNNSMDINRIRTYMPRLSSA